MYQLLAVIFRPAIMWFVQINFLISPSLYNMLKVSNLYESGGSLGHAHRGPVCEITQKKLYYYLTYGNFNDCLRKKIPRGMNFFFEIYRNYELSCYKKILSVMSLFLCKQINSWNKWLMLSGGNWSQPKLDI